MGGVFRNGDFSRGNLNLQAAHTVLGMIRADFPAADATIDCAKGLVCYYAEKGGMIIGYEV